MELKQILKTIKLHEGNISMALGALVIIVLAVMVARYFKNQSTNQILPTGTTQTRQTHTVARGESLWKIAEKYYANGMEWSRIAKENNITNANQIEVGQELSIPEVSAESKETATTTNVETKQTQPESGKIAESITGANYEVVKGDCLWKIAVRAYQDGYKWPLLAKENKIKNPNLIYPGDKLIIPR